MHLSSKTRLKYESGKDLGENTSLVLRASSIQSNSYRKYHGSKQQGVFFGLENRGTLMKNQFRALIGYENTQLSWDGVAGFLSGEKQSDINDRTKRRDGYRAYTDDFLQQIYSVNSTAKISDKVSFRNVAYLVVGSGYYEVFKSDQDFYSYNLDIENVIKFLDTHPQVSALNSKIKQKDWRTKNQ